MKLLDSDLLGILLALATFIVPAVSGMLEKKRKEKKRREVELHPQSQLESPYDEDAGESEEEAPSLNGEIEELFNVLMGKDTTVQEEEILPDSQQESYQQEFQNQEPVQGEDHEQWKPAKGETDELAAEELPEPMHRMVEEQVKPQTEQMEAMAQPEPREENSLKKRIKGNPKEAIVLSEILTPKFKEYN